MLNVLYVNNKRNQSGVIKGSAISRSYLFDCIGYKGQLYEGGTRVPGFVHSPLLAHRGYTSDALVHITDWFPTLLRVAGIAKDQVNALAPSMDGIDQHSVFFTQNKERAVR